MEQTVKDLCFTISGLSSEFSVLGRSKVLPDDIRAECRRLGVELLDLDRQLYFASFIENDAKITEIVNAIEVAADKADGVNKEIDELSAAVKKAREVVQKTNETVSDLTEAYEDAVEFFEDACEEVERVLEILGVENE